MIGERFGKLLVVRHEERRGREPMVRAACDCGREKIVRARSLKSGNTSSCGCVHVVHGGSASSEYVSWQSMHARCGSPKHPAFAAYAGRGIKVCPEWSDAATFLRDMGPKPTLEHSLERIDNDGDYTPANCRWATPAEQSLNRRTNRLITAFGETLPLKVWAQRSGLGRTTIRHRLGLGWPAERAVSEPVRC